MQQERDQQLDLKDQTDHLLDPTKEVEVRGHKVVVRVVKVKDLSKFHAAISPWYKQCNAISDKFAAIDSPTIEQISQYKMDMFDLVCSETDNMIKACVACSNADEKFLQRIDPYEFTQIASAVVELNMSFFVRCVAPTLITAWKAASTLGMTLSNTSLRAATHTQR